MVWKARKKGNKYNAVKTVVDNITFDSKKEAARYKELKLLEKVGEIKDLELQPGFQLFAKSGDKVCKYYPDFMYLEKGEKIVTVEDVKGKKTDVYRIKSKWFQADYPQYKFIET